MKSESGHTANIVVTGSIMIVVLTNTNISFICSTDKSNLDL